MTRFCGLVPVVFVAFAAIVSAGNARVGCEVAPGKQTPSPPAPATPTPSSNSSTPSQPAQTIPASSTTRPSPESSAVPTTFSPSPSAAPVPSTAAPLPPATTTSTPWTTTTPSIPATTAPVTQPPVVPPVGGSGTIGICYEPFHSALYPLRGGDGSHLADILDQDLRQLSKHFSHVRTYHSQFFGVGMGAYASKYNLKLYLGIHHFDNADWNNIEINAAVDAAKNYPNTVEAIIVGNENLVQGGGDKTVQAIIDDVNLIKSKLQAAGVTNVLVGTAQRISVMLDSSSELDRLVNACDFVGVHIYPFFTNGWDPSQPLALLQNQWNQITSRFASQKSKLRLTETGWPSAGSAPAGLPANVPSIANQQTYYQALKSWQPQDKNGPSFWFMAYDRRSDDPFLGDGLSYEQYFGLYTATNDAKGGL